MTLPLVTIVVRTAGRRDRFLDEAIVSALAQSHRELEVLVVWDAARPLPAKLRDWTVLEPRVRIVTPGPVGFVEAANVGVREAAGELLGFLDDDDTLRSWHVERLVNALASDAAAAGAYDDVLELECNVENETLSVRHRWEGSFTAAELRQDNRRPPSAFLFRRSVALAHPWREAAGPCADWDFLLSMQRKGARFVHVPGVGSEYRIRQDGSNMISKDRAALLAKTAEVRARHAS